MKYQKVQLFNVNVNILENSNSFEVTSMKEGSKNLTN